jgi:hypothetical protein
MPTYFELLFCPAMLVWVWLPITVGAVCAVIAKD